MWTQRQEKQQQHQQQKKKRMEKTAGMFRKQRIVLVVALSDKTSTFC